MTLEGRLHRELDWLTIKHIDVDGVIRHLLLIIQQEIADACKKAKIEELGKFLIIVSGATNILDRMQTIEVLHNRIMELDKPPSLEPKSPSPLDEVK